jgi:hypothetical protein
VVGDRILWGWVGFGSGWGGGGGGMYLKIILSTYVNTNTSFLRDTSL